MVRCGYFDDGQSMYRGLVAIHCSPRHILNDQCGGDEPIFEKDYKQNVAYYVVINDEIFYNPYPTTMFPLFLNPKIRSMDNKYYYSLHFNHLSYLP